MSVFAIIALHLTLASTGPIDSTKEHLGSSLDVHDEAQFHPFLWRQRHCRVCVPC